MKFTDRQTQYLILSDAAYQKPDAEKKAKQLGWKKLSRYSNGECNVFIKKSKCVIAFRGTQSGKDFLTDVKAVAANTGRYDDRRFAEATDVAKRVLKNIGDHYSVQVTGHSLGGTIAQYIGRLFCLGGVCFNPGSSPTGRLRKVMVDAARKGMKYRHAKNCTRVQIVRIASKSQSETDWISQNAGSNFPGSKDTKVKPAKKQNLTSQVTLSNHFTSALYAYT